MIIYNKYSNFKKPIHTPTPTVNSKRLLLLTNKNKIFLKSLNLRLKDV